MGASTALIPKFFVFGSVILILTGLAQFLVRPRKDKETLAGKIANRATITAVLSVSMGVLGLLVGFGVIPLPR